MNHHQEIQSQKPAQASSKAMVEIQNPKTGRSAKQVEQTAKLGHQKSIHFFIKKSVLICLLMAMKPS